MLTELADFATIASGIALTLSVLFVGYELRVNARLARASNAQSLVELSTSLIAQVIQSRETSALWAGGLKPYPEMDELDRFRYRTLVTWWLIFHENIHFQFHKGLLDSDVYSAWDYELRAFIKSHHLESYWSEIRCGFQGAFAHHIDSIVKERDDE